jgi:hypothetical protein
MKSYLLKLSLLVTAAIIFTGCATTEHMTAAEGEVKLAPDPGKSMVVFMRPSSYGGAILSTVYDGMEYIGTVPANTRFSYQTEPGEHMFMVIGESADFMKADLAPDKTYYARVAARMGVWKARFSFIPYNGGDEDELQEWINDTKPMQMNEKGKIWAEQNAASIKAKHDEDLPEWEQKREELRAKQTLLKNSGR